VKREVRSVKMIEAQENRKIFWTLMNAEKNDKQKT